MAGPTASEQMGAGLGTMLTGWRIFLIICKDLYFRETSILLLRKEDTYYGIYNIKEWRENAADWILSFSGFKCRV